MKRLINNNKKALFEKLFHVRWSYSIGQNYKVTLHWKFFLSFTITESISKILTSTMNSMDALVLESIFII